jgi:hypothetical protein
VKHLRSRFPNAKRDHVSPHPPCSTRTQCPCPGEERNGTERAHTRTHERLGRLRKGGNCTETATPAARRDESVREPGGNGGRGAPFVATKRPGRSQENRIPRSFSPEYAGKRRPQRRRLKAWELDAAPRQPAATTTRRRREMF